MDIVHQENSYLLADLLLHTCKISIDDVLTISTVVSGLIYSDDLTCYDYTPSGQSSKRIETFPRFVFRPLYPELSFIKINLVVQKAQSFKW